MIFFLVVLVGHTVIFSAQWEELLVLVEKEESQKKEFINKLTQANNLEQLRTHKNQSAQQLTQLEQQLPEKAAMDATLSDINQTGVKRGLQFESFKPGEVEAKEFVAELPITIKMNGSYHALAGFVSDVANLSRLVVIDHIAITAMRDGVQNFDAVIRIFYRIDSDEFSNKKKIRNEKTIRAQS
ncbi:MAG: type 4a pilus biogenesis protein PilO [Burkholderiales bacterium]|nr:type 4a pilus biogenesis protein PilO [Burkholderiales bacterium]